MNQFMFSGKDEELYNTEEEIVKTLTLGEKMCNNEHCKNENCSCDPCTCTEEQCCSE